MAIAPVKSVGLDAALPTASSAVDQITPETPIILDIGAKGEYRLNSAAVEASLLRDRLVEIYRRRADRVLFVKADGKLEFATIAAAIDTAHGANVDRVALMPR